MSCTFCALNTTLPCEDRGNDVRGGGTGTFQKASVDEAYLAPARGTLMAELSLAQHGYNPAGASVVSSPTDKGRGVKRSRSANDERRTFLAGGEQRLDGEHPTAAANIGSVGVRFGVSREESGASESQGRTEGEDHEWDIAKEGSLGEERPQTLARQGRCAVGHQRMEEDDEEDRLLEAGGLLGKRIQQTLSDVLNYDCSVGVAGNKV